MNLLGKILTLLIMVMSLLFLFVAFMVAASHQNWKEIAETNKSIADQRLADQRLIQAEIDKKDLELKQEQVARQLLISQVESQYQTAKELYDTKERELTSMLADLQEKTKTLKEAEERLKEQDQTVANLDTQNRTLTENISAEHAKVIELQNQVFEDRGKLEALQRTKAALAQSLAMSEKVLKANGLSKDSLTAQIPPILNGEVTGVTGDLINVSLGTDDGLHVGHTVDIHRDGQFRASAKVYSAKPNESIVRLIPEMTKSAVQVGDEVTTEWSRPIAQTGN